MIENLPILYSQEDDYEEKYNNKSCEDYMKSLLWTTHYYFNDCINWRFCSDFNHGPSFKNLSRFLMNNKIEIYKDNNEFSNLEQLSYIFPNDSHILHDYSIKDRKYKLILDFSHSRYLWECSIDFISS